MAVSILEQLEDALKSASPHTVDTTQQEIRRKLAELGGQLVTDETIVRDGDKLVIPKNMTPKQAVVALTDYIKAEDSPTVFSRTYKYRPWDGAYAFSQTVKKHFGFMVGKPIPGFFSDTPPQLHTISVGPNQTVQVPWGRVQLPFLPDTNIDLSSAFSNEDGPLFQLVVSGPRKFRHHVEGLFRLVQTELDEHSLYRGKAFDGREMPEFLDLSGVDPSRVIYADSVMEQLEANVWSLLKHTERMKQYGLPLKRAVLFEGPYGTGKTLGAYLTAKIAVDNGWTFIMCRPGQDDPQQVMQTAKLYQPAVVFIEDIDVIADTSGDAEYVSHLLDTFDGITSKGLALEAVFTTNHVDKIHKGMLRPGRMDAVIHIADLDQNGVERMVRALVPVDLLGEIDYGRVFQAMEGFLPAFCKEAIDRAKRYSISHNAGELRPLTTEDLVAAAEGLRPQLNLMNGNSDQLVNPTVDKQLKAIVSEVVRENVHPNVLTRIEK